MPIGHPSSRKKSPRAPSIALDEAVARALRVYEKERRHPAPADVVAQHMGYKGANNGAALAALASLRYFGLLDRPEEGKLAASKDLETYQFAPSEQLKRDLLIKWLKSPPLFAELLEQYSESLPSDATLQFELINRGFNPPAAKSLVGVFKRSVDFAGYSGIEDLDRRGVSQDKRAEEDPEESSSPERASRREQNGLRREMADSDFDEIPVRLQNARKAWIIVPSPLFLADKERLKAQIDLLLTDD